MLPLLALLITLALSWSKQLQGRRVNIHHNIQILDFPVNVFVRTWTSACWGLHNHRTTWQPLDTSASSKNSSLSWVYRHKHFLLITTLSLVQTKNIWEWLLLQVLQDFTMPAAPPTSIWRRADDTQIIQLKQIMAELVMALWRCGH